MRRFALLSLRHQINDKVTIYYSNNNTVCRKIRAPNFVTKRDIVYAQSPCRYSFRDTRIEKNSGAKHSMCIFVLFFDKRDRV